MINDTKLKHILSLIYTLKYIYNRFLIVFNFYKLYNFDYVNYYMCSVQQLY